jgi:hypothetical protein
VAAGVAGRVQHRQQQRWAEQNQPAYEEQAAAPPAGVAPDYTAELQQLAKLRDDGVITAEDFDAKKRQLLGI